VVPLLTRVYPNGSADVNAFQAAGGPGFVIRELRDAGLMHPDVATVRPEGLQAFTLVPHAAGDACAWRDPGVSGDETVVRGAATPFGATGGLKLLQGNLGRSVIKVSAVPDDRHVVEAPARIFDSQEACTRPLPPANSIAMWSAWCAGRDREPTACRSCTNSRRRWRCCRARVIAWRW
jgi:phosphogluconate dehydratase